MSIIQSGTKIIRHKLDFLQSCPLPPFSMLESVENNIKRQENDSVATFYMNNIETGEGANLSHSFLSRIVVALLPGQRFDRAVIPL